MTAVSGGAACPVCATDAGFDRALGTLERCRSCGFIAYRGASPAELAALYDDRYFAGAEYPDYLGQEAALRRSMRRHLRQMARYTPLRGALLEIGCAYGLFLDEARAHFSRVMGIDVCAGPVAYARATLGLDVRCGDFLTAGLGGERFDVVCMWDTIEHLPTPDAFLSRAVSVLRPGGMLFLTTGDIGALNARLRGARWRQIHPPTHVSYFSRDTIARLCARAGLEVMGAETAAYYHTVYNVLASIRLRGALPGRVASAMLATLGERMTRRAGVWLDLGDIMFVAARRAG